MGISIAERTARTFAAGAIAFSLVSCLDTKQFPQVPSTGKSAEVQQQGSTEVAFFKDAIAALPPSIMKDELTSRIVPLFITPSPKSIEIGSYTIPMHNPTIRSEIIPGGRNQMNLFGEFLPFADNQEVSKLHPTTETRVLLPYVMYVTPQEARGKLSIKNGAFFVPVKLLPTVEFSEELNPEITIITDYIGRLQGQDRIDHEKIREFMNVKEALNFWLYLLRLEAELATLEKMGDQATIEATSNELTKIVNIIPAVDWAMTQQNGRMKSGLDLQAYVLAIKAYEGTDMLSTLGRDPRYASAISSLRSVNFGDNPQDIFSRSSEWVVNNRASLRFLLRAGVLENIP